VKTPLQDRARCRVATAREVLMKLAGSDVETFADVETLTAVIAHSQIVVGAAPAQRFLAGFDEVDIAILDWIVAESRYAGRGFVRM
jgi:hypothetical protein